jgi:AbiU2
VNAVVNQTPEVEFQNRLGALAHDARSAARYAYAGAAINAIASQRTEVVARLNRHAGFWNVVLGAAQTAAVVGLGRIYDTRKDVLSARRLLEHATRYTGIYRVAPVAALRPRSSREADWRPGLRLLAGQGLADGADGSSC